MPNEVQYEDIIPPSNTTILELKKRATEKGLELLKLIDEKKEGNKY